MKVQIINGNIIHIIFESQYLMCSTLMRLEEFYESPFPEIRGHFFTHEQYMDRYAEAYGNFTYTLDWSGFNIPGNVVLDFFEVFCPKGDVLNKEYDVLYKIVGTKISSKKKFYLIATCDTTENYIVDHEMAHLMYYLNTKYKKGVDTILKTMDLDILYQYLIHIGYCVDMLVDEANAYLTTGVNNDMKSLGYNDSVKLRDLFIKHSKED